MSAFNTLHTAITCDNCGRQFPARIQFTFGDTWLFDYQMGDKIKWGGNDSGVPHLPKVKVYGCAESTLCPFCNYNSPNDQYDIFIEDDVIKSIQVMASLNDYTDGNGEYVIVKE